MLRQNPEAAQAAVRTYRPEEHLRSVDRETQQLVEDSRDVPRMWDPDSPAEGPWLLQMSYLFLFGAGFVANLSSTTGS